MVAAGEFVEANILELLILNKLYIEETRLNRFPDVCETAAFVVATELLLRELITDSAD
jgi:hypothetical protein